MTTAHGITDRPYHSENVHNHSLKFCQLGHVRYDSSGVKNPLICIDVRKGESCVQVEFIQRGPSMLIRRIASESTIHLPPISISVFLRSPCSLSLQRVFEWFFECWMGVPSQWPSASPRHFHVTDERLIWGYGKDCKDNPRTLPQRRTTKPRQSCR